jgi:hypothetical protein
MITRSDSYWIKKSAVFIRVICVIRVIRVSKIRVSTIDTGCKTFVFTKQNLKITHHTVQQPQ